MSLFEFNKYPCLGDGPQQPHIRRPEHTISTKTHPSNVRDEFGL